MSSPNVAARRPASILVIAAEPDDRPSTAALRLVIRELRRRDGVRVTVWFLRTDPVGPEPWDGTTVVDGLRTWRPAALLQGMLVPLVPDWLRGRRLRGWLREVAPDVVVLDDGRGARVVETLAPPPVRVVRHNPDAPPRAWLEPDEADTADVLIVPAGAAAGGGVTAPRTLVEPELFDVAPYERFVRAEARAEVRRHLDVPVDAPLVVGWGTDEWIDGPDLFVRALWALEHRRGVAAHGLWLGLGDDPAARARLDDEAARCGLAGRVHFRAEPTLDARLAGDAVLLPYRGAVEWRPVFEASCSGLPVVTFAAAEITDPTIRVVPDLDVEEAAGALAAGLGDDRAAAAAAARRRFGVACFVDDLLAACARTA